MDKEELDRHKDVLARLKRRKHGLEMQKATYGISADPSIDIQIEDLDKEIKQLEREIAQAQSTGGTTPPIQTDASTSRASGPGSSTITTNVDVVILTILPEEYWPIRNRLNNPRNAPTSRSSPDLYSWVLGTVPTREAGVSYTVALGILGRAGTTSSALATLDGIDRWHPSYIFFVGIAGGFNREGLQKGDVAIADVIYGYEYGKLEKEFIPRHNWVYRTDGPLLNRAQVFASNPYGWTRNIQVLSGERQPRAIAGAIASGDKVVDDPTNAFFAQVQATWPKLLAVEMEGVGVAAAIEQANARRLAVGFLMIRGISDMPRPPQTTPSQEDQSRGTDERDTWKARATEAAAEFTIGLIAEGLPIPPAEPAVVPQHVGPAVPRPIMPQVSLPDPSMAVDIDKRELRRRMAQKFDDDRLRILCEDINALLEQAGNSNRVSLEIVGGRGLEAIILSLIQYLERRNLLHFLVAAVRAEEPDII